MLTESYLLSRALQEADIALEVQHPAIQEPGISTGPLLRVRLDEAGAVVSCERMEDENLAGRWSHFDGNHNSFPIIRLAEPLMELSEVGPAAGHDETRGKGKRPPLFERRKALTERLSRAQPRKLSKKTLDLLTRLRDKADELAQALDGHNDGVVRVCRAYRLAVPANVSTTVPLIEELRKRAAEQITCCEESELEALEVLLFTASDKPGGKKAQIALDDKPGSPSIYSYEVKRTVKKAHRARDEGDSGITTPKTTALPPACAYTGSTELWTGPFPRVKLPVLGKEFYIFSMNSDAPCNVRYHHLTDSRAAPVGRRLVLDLQDTLHFILAEERKGRTWRSIASEKPGVFDQLIVYVEGKPDIPAVVADFFGEAGDTEQEFSADASAVCEALDGIRQARPGSRLNLFILRKASEGQAFVILSESPTVEEVLAGAEWWNLAARNVPLGKPTDEYCISLPILNKSRKLERRKPSEPYPGQVAALLSEVWPSKAGGSAYQTRARKDKLRGIAFSQVLDMMLQRPAKAELAAKKVLSLCLSHTGPLLRGLGECRHRQKQESWRAYSDKERLTALRAVSTLGIALYVLQSKKEDYMHEAAFQVGQLLSLADRLHRCYCTVVRGGAMPPNLIGNSVFDAALDNPERALALLAERVRVYLAWASTAEPAGDEQKRIATLEAKKILRLYRPLAAALHEQGVPDSCGDILKAHMLLGYLAGQESETRTEEEDK